MALVALLVVSGYPVHASEAWLWDVHQQADALEAAGDVTAAVPLWRELAAGYARRQNWTNAAIYWKKLGHALEAGGEREEAVRAYENEAFFWTKAGHADWGLADLITADTLRSTIRLFQERPGSPPAAGELAPFEPQSGAYLGVYSELDPAVQSFPDRAAAAYGRPHAAFLVYVPWRQRYTDLDTWFPRLWAERARQAGAALQVHWMPHRGLDDVRDDAYLRAFAREARDTGIPIFLRFGGEMNGDWVAWHGDPELYVQKWRLVARIMREEAPNVALVWAPNHVPSHNIDPYYPGDAWVDWVGISLYQDYYASGLPEYKADRENPLDKIRDIYDRYAAGKPIMIAEWGSAHREYTYGAEITDWGVLQLQRLYGALPLLYPRVKAVFYFSVDQRQTPNPFQPGTVWSSYLLTEKPAVQAAYREATAAPYFHTRVEAAGRLAATHHYAELTDFTHVDAGPETFAAYVKIYDPWISRVEYHLQGYPPSVRTAFPYEYGHDFAADSGRTLRLEITVYNSQGGVEGRRLIRLVVGQPPAAAPFVDMEGRRHWAEALVARMSAYGIIGGFPDSTFRPDDTITREQFLKLVAEALGLPPGAEGTPGFGDVPAGRWSFGPVAAAVSAGLITPDEYSGARLKPGDAIPRLEMAVLVVRALGLWKEAEFESYLVPFADAAAIPAERHGYAALAAERGLIGGLPGNLFAGSEPATRAQAAVVIARLLDALAGEEQR